MLVVVGTRPEVIKLAPVVRALDSASDVVRTLTIASGQHADLLHPLARDLGLRIRHDLGPMEPAQTPDGVRVRVRARLEPILRRERPDLVLVQGDTSTALGAAQAGVRAGVPVAHVEAGLRSGDPASPWPEETNRRRISRLATFHFAPTVRNRENLLAEEIPPDRVFVTGNPGVDTLTAALSGIDGALPRRTAALLEATRGRCRIVLTTHRREAFAGRLEAHLRALRTFVMREPGVAVIWPVHPNPRVVRAAEAHMRGHPRIVLTEPLGYAEFVALLDRAWLVLSDSGGIQEEVPTLGRPLVILRENTERPEVLDTGLARLLGPRPEALPALLEEAGRPGSWVAKAGRVENPFGSGDSGPRIARLIVKVLNLSRKRPDRA